MRILCAGGGTLGSVTPLIAIIEELRSRMERDAVGQPDVLWIGTKKGVEKDIVCASDIPFHSIYTGKLRQYFDVRNLIDPFLLCIGIIQSLIAILRFRPDVIIGAGSFVSVPVLWAGWLLRKRAMILQLDIVPSLSNLLTSFCAQAILVACKEEERFFPSRKTHTIGIPVRLLVQDWKQKMEHESERRSARESFGIHDDLPVAVVMGGGTGSQFINALIMESVSDLEGVCHIIHIIGKGKAPDGYATLSHYHHYEFLTDRLIIALALADVVVTRAGMGSLAELSALGKPCIIIPIPHSHQEQNALYFEKRNAALYCSQDSLTKKMFGEKMKKLFHDTLMREEYSLRMSQALEGGARQRSVDILLSL
ncbi:MAG: UDP-N-acetylglucosamine--N-acetylmuramyl-(pentapeptide) pyrophosphoryl-undecaprenol N-acetylglucosamine transferase [Patescibacteria group bacterium]